MSGEILRGVLDASCAFSAPAFYSVTFPQLNNGLVATRVPITAFLQLKSDRWFLLTGVAFFTVNPPGVLYNNPSNGVVFDLFDANNRKSFFSNPQQTNSALMNGTSADFMTLPDYIEFKPNDVIGLRADAVTTDATFWTFAVLAGLEYAK